MLTFQDMKERGGKHYRAEKKIRAKGRLQHWVLILVVSILVHGRIERAGKKLLTLTLLKWDKGGCFQVDNLICILILKKMISADG